MKVAKELDLPLKKSRGERMKTEQMDAGSSMATHLLQIVPPAVVFVSAVILNLAEMVGAIDTLDVVQKYGGAGLAGIFAYWLIRWLLNDKQKKEDKIEQMHKERLEVAEKQATLYQEMLRKIKDERTYKK